MSETSPDTVVIGDVTCTRVSDGSALYPCDALFAGADATTVAEELGPRLRTDLTVRSQYDCILMRGPAATILVDTGLGRLAEVAGAPAGRLIDALARAGATPEQIDVVVLTHAHPDHIGGLVTDNRLTFPNARHVMTENEWKHWTSPDNLARMPEMWAAPAGALLPPLAEADALDLVRGTAEVAPGIHVVPAPGHTPGHCVVTVTGGGQTLVLIADAVIDVLQFSHPAWVCAFDHDAAQTVATRRRLMAEAAHDGSPLFGYHIGRFGRVEPGRGDGFVWRDGA